MNNNTAVYLKKVCSSFDEIFKNSVLTEKNLCVCLSGGADSTALLISLKMLNEKYRYNLYAVHVNHLLRDAEAFRDEKFCIELCKKLKIKLYKTRIDINKLAEKSKKSIEETARDARYSYFENLGKKEKINFFATAHTKNDNAETIYMNIIRGTTVTGLCGIPQVKGNVIRPILKVSREENIAFLKEKGYTFVTDSSNNDNTYTRNFIRNVFLPSAKRINPKVIDSAERLSSFAKSDENYFAAALENIPKGKKDTQLHPALLRRKLQREYAALTGGNSLMSVHLDAIMSLPYSEHKKYLSMPNGVTAVIKSGKISFILDKNLKKITDSSIYELKYGENKFAGEKVSIFYYNGIFKESENIYNNYTQIRLYFGKIVGGIKYRARCIGDKIFCLGVNKSIKKEFISKGVPSHLRDMIPIFYDDTGIIYVPFIGAADRVYADKNANTDQTVTIKVIFNERQD